MSVPTLSSISPTSGSIEGGTSVIITGTNLSNVIAVTIGDNVTTDLIVLSTQIACTTPAGAAGTYDVVTIADNYGETWTQARPTPLQRLAFVAISSDGTIQTAVSSASILYSVDTGQTWSKSIVPSDANYTAVAMSSDGTIQTAVISGGSDTASGIYMSTNYGESWDNLNNNAPSANWTSVAMSSNGQIQTAVVYDGFIYTSTNYGETWDNLNNDAPSANWVGVAMSSNGKIQTAVISDGIGIESDIYTSTNYGETWDNLNNAPPANWKSVTMSSNGQIQTAVVYDGFIYTSTNYGETWDNLNNKAPSANWVGVAMSSDGRIQTAVIDNGGIYTTTNYGETWTQSSAIAAIWKGVAMSSDGTCQTAVEDDGFKGGIYTSNPISSNSLPYTYENIVLSNICFPAGTPVTTDQGNIPIEKINPEIHTIHNNKIVAITKTIAQDTHLVCFKKHALGLNKPNKKTITSKQHKVYYNGKMTKAYHFLKQFKNVTEIEYNGEILYNVLMEKHDKIKVNNLTFETLDPKNIIAKLCTSNFDKEYKNNIIVMINNSIMQKDHSLYQNIINRVVNDKSLSTCFEEPEYEEPEYEEPVNTTRLDTLRNSAEKTYHTQSVNVKNKICLDNVTLHGKLTKYIKAQQSKDNQEAEVVQEEAIEFNFRINMDNNVNLHSRLNKYMKTNQNKDNIDEIIKKKEFLNLKNEEKEEKERQKLIEIKNKMIQPVVEKAKTYKRVQLFKRNGTSKRLFYNF